MDLFPEGVKEILRVLKGKAFYQNRFLDQILALYVMQPVKPSDDLRPTLYLSSLYKNIEIEKHCIVGEWCAQQLVTSFQECPSPALLAELIVEGSLRVYGLDFPMLYLRAQEFFLYPPKDQKIADRWIERIIYSSTLLMGRETFMTVDAAQWKLSVIKTIVGDRPLVSLTIKVNQERSVVKRSHADFLRLKKTVGINHEK